MKTPLKSFEIIKEMYEYFIKTHRELEPKLMICEKEDFENVETALKDLEWLKSILNIDFFDNLTTEDKVRLLKIMRVKIDYE